MMSAGSDTQRPKQDTELSIESVTKNETDTASDNRPAGDAEKQISIDCISHTQTDAADSSITYICSNENTNKAGLVNTERPNTIDDDPTAKPGGIHDDWDSPRAQPHNVLESGDNFFVTYFGELVLDQRHTHQMLPWVIAEVRRRQQSRFILLQVLCQTLRAVTCDSTVSSQQMFEHKLQSLSRFARSHQDPKCFAYLTRTSAGSIYTCHVFQASDEPMVHEVFSVIRDATKETVKDEACLQDLIPPGGSLDAMGLSMQVMMTHLYEVLFVGRVLVAGKKTPPTFIDEVIDKFHQYDEEQKKVADFDRRRNVSGTSVRSLPSDLEETVQVCENELSLQKPCFHNGSVDSSDTIGTDGSGGDAAMLGDSSGCLNTHCEQSQGISNDGYDIPQHTYDPENRIRLIQVGDTELCLISPDRKSVILQRKFKDISFCSQGIKYRDHFGFISRELTSNSFLCYVFKCSDESVVEEIMKTLKQAFNLAFQQTARNRVICQLCPMRQLHQLCVQVNRLPADQVNELLLKRVCHLKEKDRSEIIQRLEMENPESVAETNEVLMAILREMCELKQTEHTHISETSKAKAHRHNEFNLVECGKSKSSKFDALRSRAKKSLTNSFESLIRGRNKKEELRYLGRRWTLTAQNSVPVIEDKQEEEGPRGRRWTITSESNLPQNEDLDQSLKTSDVCDAVISNPSDECAPEVAYEMGRPRSFTAPSGGCDQPPVLLSSNHKQKPSKSVVPSFFRIESYLRSNVMAGGRHCPEEESSPLPPQGESSSGSELVSRKKGPAHRQKSWRLEILNRVVTPVSRGNSFIESPDSTMTPVSEVTLTPTKLSPRELRDLWKKAILEVLLLIKMERENKNLRVRQTEAQMKRLKLDYEEITPCLKPMTDAWEEMLRTPEGIKIDMDVIHDAVKDGVPRNRRGDIWWLLMEQHKLHRRRGQQPVEEMTIQYKDLLKQLTSYQHAILIDLGRTFPSHPYFARQLGAGQLSLFNLLKAYSLLDKQVGYCQGLSFVAGVLLMHMPEEQSFEALRYILFGLGFRQQYESDMVSMQIQLYQLSRLLHDHHPDLYRHLETHEIAPVHYSAAWFLTMFASEFPLAFVSRVFDLIFLQGIDVIFKVALVLLDNHKDLIIQCDSIESIMTFLKTTLPNMGIIRMEQVFNQVFALDISSALKAYEVEYHVLQEEMISSPPQYHSSDDELQIANETLRNQNAKLMELLQKCECNTLTLEQALHSNKSQADGLEQQLHVLHESHNKLQSHVDTLVRERAALLKIVDRLQALVPEGATVATDDVTVSGAATQNTLQTQLLDNIPAELNNSLSIIVDHDTEKMADNKKVTGQGQGCMLVQDDGTVIS